MTFMTCERLSPAQAAKVRNLRKWVLVTSALFLPLNTISFVHPMHGPTGIVVAALAGTGFFAIIVLGMLMLLRSVDEFRRELLMRSLTWATVITVGVLSIYGYVDLLHPVELPRIPLFVVPLFLILTMTAAKLLIFRQHRISNDE